MDAHPSTTAEPVSFVLTALFEAQYADSIPSEEANLAVFDESEIDALFTLWRSDTDHGTLHA